MLHLQEKFVVRRALNPAPLDAELMSIPRSFVPRMSAVTREELEAMDVSYLRVLGERKRRGDLA